MGIDSKDGKDGELSSLPPNFMERLRAAEARARTQPDPLQQVRADLAGLRDDVRELTSCVIQGGCSPVL